MPKSAGSKSVHKSMQAIYEAITALTAEGFIPISFCGFDVGRDNGLMVVWQRRSNIEALIRIRTPAPVPTLQISAT